MTAITLATANPARPTTNQSPRVILLACARGPAAVKRAPGCAGRRRRRTMRAMPTPVLARLAVALAAVLAIACDFRLTNPAAPSVTINNTTTNTNDNRNNVTPVAPAPTPTPAPGTTTTIPGGTGPRPGDPPAGGPLPLPTGAQGTILALGQQYAALVQSCSFAFVDALVSALRASDTRWGYVCKRGSCADISQDVVAYHAAAGADVTGATGTYELDVIGNSCSPIAAPQFLNLGYGPANVFSPTR